MLTADALVRWFLSFQVNLPLEMASRPADFSIDAEQLRCLTSNVNLDEIWQRIIRHCHPIEHVKKVRETLKIGELKERHPDRWEQQKNAQIHQGQMEQRIAVRLREISAARHEQSTHLTNELQRLESMIDEEFSQIAALEKQLQIYRHVSQLFTDFSQRKEQLHLFAQPSGNIESTRDLIEKKSSSMDSVHLLDLCSTLNPLVEQRIHQLKCVETNISPSFVEIYEDAASQVNVEFTKQFVHLANIRAECGKVRERLNECQRDVLSRRSPHEQTQLLAILEAMISRKSIDVHLNLLKKKIQSEVEATNKSDEKHLPRLQQQLNEKRTELNHIDQQLNQIIHDNPLDKLEKLEGKIRDYLRLLTDLPGRIHSLNLMHLALSNDLRSNLLHWPVEHFLQLNIPSSPVDTSSPLPPLPAETPPTPLTSLKQLLGIRTQDVVQLEPPVQHITERWNEEEGADQQQEEIFEKHFPAIGSIDWDLFARVDQQMEEALKQCEQDALQYDQIFANLFNEIRVLQVESLSFS